MFLALPILALALASAANADDTLTVGFFPAIPALTELLVNSEYTAAVWNRTEESTVWVIAGKRHPSSSTWDDVTVSITAYGDSSQVFTYIPVATSGQTPASTEVACEITPTTTAKCEITPAGANPTESTYSTGDFTFYQEVGFDISGAEFVDPVKTPSSAARLASSLSLGICVAFVSLVALLL